MSINCETCEKKFGAFRKKLLCEDCNQFHCKKCSRKPAPILEMSRSQWLCLPCHSVRLVHHHYEHNSCENLDLNIVEEFFCAKKVPFVHDKNRAEYLMLVQSYFEEEKQNDSSDSKHDQSSQRDTAEFAVTSETTTSIDVSTPSQQGEEDEHDDDAINDSDDDDTTANEDDAMSSSENSQEPRRPQPSAQNMRANEMFTQAFIAAMMELAVENSMSEEEYQADQAQKRKEFEQQQELKAKRDISKYDTMSDFRKMRVRDLRTILEANHVDTKDCIEKTDLIDKVAEVWRQQRAEGEDLSEDNLCKICCDSPVNCLLMPCRHLFICIDCSDKVQECPQCRQTVQDRIRVFRT